MPLCEVKFTSREIPIQIRKGYGAKKKVGQDFGRLRIYKSVSLATRVQIQRAIAEKIEKKKETATVLGTRQGQVCKSGIRPILLFAMARG